MFKKGDQVHVYFISWTAGLFSKFASYWRSRGPFILDELTDFMYDVILVIHVNRVRLKHRWRDAGKTQFVTVKSPH